MQVRLAPRRPPQAVAAQRAVVEHRPPEPRLVAELRRPEEEVVEVEAVAAASS